MATFTNLSGVNGTKKDFAFTFPYIKQTDLKVELISSAHGRTELDSSKFTFPNATTIRFASTSGTNWQETDGAPKSGVTGTIIRDTDSSKLAATFYPGSAIKSSDLNENFDQNLYVTQEAEYDANTALSNSRELVSGSYVSAISTANTAKTAADTAKDATDKVVATFNSSNNTWTLKGNNTNAATDPKGVGWAITKAEEAVDTADDAETASTNAVNTANNASAAVSGKLDKNGGTMTGAIVHHSSQTFDAAKITSGILPAARLDDASITSAKLHADAVVTQSEQAAVTSPLDTHFLTAKASDARYFLSNNTETLESSHTWVADNSKIATALAVDNRVTALVEEVGGFRAIANETSFPDTNPDINNNAGTLVSIKALAGSLTSNSSGVATISNGNVSNNATITIEDLGDTKTYAAGFGLLVETTSTTHTYKFHRQLAKPNDVNTVAGISSAVSTVAGMNTAITTVNSNSTSINAVNSNSTNINAVAGELLHSKDLGSITAAVEEEDGNNDINTIATNIAQIQSFADVYRVSGSAPSSSLDAGDLWFDSSGNALKVYNGSAWVVTASAGLAELSEDTTPELGGNLDCNNKNLTEVATVSGDNLQIDFGAIA